MPSRECADKHVTDMRPGMFQSINSKADQNNTVLKSRLGYRYS